eukprot:Opistho-1_new@30416
MSAATARHRKPAPEAARPSPQSEVGDDDKEPVCSFKEDALLWVLGLALGALIALSVSYATTGTFVFEGDARVAAAWRSLKLKVGGVPEITLEELARHDGSDPDTPIYLAIMGRVYDVTAGRSIYGVGGSYHKFAGKDASRAFTTGNFKDDLKPDLDDLTEKQVAEVRKWVDFYETSNKYFFVGYVKGARRDGPYAWHKVETNRDED